MKKLTIIHDIGIKDRPVHNLPANPKLSHYARNNRKAGNLAEIVFWIQVHRKMFHGLDFDRQKVIGNYIADFYVIIHINYPALRAPLLKIRRGIGFERHRSSASIILLQLGISVADVAKATGLPIEQIEALKTEI